MPTTIFDSRGQPLRLGSLIGKGGEGEVYELATDGQRVVKLYQKPLSMEQAGKIQAMVRLQTEALTKVAAWPLDTLHRRAGSEVAGLVMPKVSGHQEIHNLYSPKSRLAAFPNANWKFLLQAATNLARAFAVVHEHGHLVGDVNHGNVLVSPQSTVRLIDCDSFQIRDNGRLFLCEVGVSTHVPPELQDGSLRVLRTENHDAFGLAVVIFQILFMGRHPFSGRYLGPGDMPIEKAIREHRFAYGASAASRQMKPPPNTLDFAAISQPVADLFERAFSSQAARGGPRPRAREWMESLASIKTVQCGRNAAHVYLIGLAACPWCDLEAGSGAIFFYFASAYSPGAAVDVSSLWARIASLPVPGQAPALPDPAAYAVQPSPAAQSVARYKPFRYAAAMLVVAAGLVAAVYVGGCTWVLILVAAGALAVAVANYRVVPVRREVKQRLKDSEETFKKLRDLWLLHAGDGPFRKKLEELGKLRKEHLEMPAFRLQRLAALESHRRSAQMERFLDQYRIARVKIPGISHGRTATLQSFGIETARDVNQHAVLRVPGFGPVLTDSLLAWRRSVESRFVFDATKGVDPADIAAMDRGIADRQDQIRQALLAGAGELEKLKHQILLSRQALVPQLETAAKALAQARADLKAL